MPLLATLLCVVALPAAADELRIAVAANFLGTLQQLAPQYTQATGDQLVLSAGSTGQLYTQIKQGAPFDVFLSADAARPKLLQSQGLILAASRFTYARGTLALWSPHAGVVDADGEVLRTGHYRFLSVADPHNAPYGAAARQVLTAMGLWTRLNQSRQIVLGEDITQTWQFVDSGNADMGFVALSQIIGAGKARGSYWLPPQSMYAPIEQDAVALAHSSKPARAQAFMRWLRTAPAALAIIRAAGYRTDP